MNKHKIKVFWCVISYVSWFHDAMYCSQFDNSKHSIKKLIALSLHYFIIASYYKNTKCTSLFDFIGQKQVFHSTYPSLNHIFYFKFFSFIISILYSYCKKKPKWLINCWTLSVFRMRAINHKSSFWTDGKLIFYSRILKVDRL